MLVLPPTTRRNRKCRRGAAMVEFAIVAPVMLVLVFALLEFTRLTMMQGLIHDAAYEAARHVMVPGATRAEGVAEANRILGFLGTDGAQVTVVPYDRNGAAQTEIEDDTSSVRVDITIPLGQNCFILSALTQGRNISATTRLAFESYDGYYDGGTN